MILHDYDKKYLPHSITDLWGTKQDMVEVLEVHFGPVTECVTTAGSTVRATVMQGGAEFHVYYNGFVNNPH